MLVDNSSDFKQKKSLKGLLALSFWILINSVSQIQLYLYHNFLIYSYFQPPSNIKEGEEKKRKDSSKFGRNKTYDS